MAVNRPRYVYVTESMNEDGGGVDRVYGRASAAIKRLREHWSVGGETVHLPPKAVTLLRNGEVVFAEDFTDQYVACASRMQVR